MLHSRISHGQSSTRSSTAPGSFVGRDSRGDVYTRERNRDRRYTGFESRVLITGIAISDGRPIVTGTIAMRSSRYADAPPKQLILDYSWLDISGEFTAVLRRALDGFVITNTGAINGDGSADSTLQPRSARRFLESRWRDAATVEQVNVQGMTYQLRLRGRHVPVVCEVESTDAEIDCATFPAAVNDVGPVVVRGGKHFTRDLDVSNANTQGWTCGMPLPFPAAHETGR